MEEVDGLRAQGSKAGDIVDMVCDTMAAMNMLAAC